MLAIALLHLQSLGVWMPFHWCCPDAAITHPVTLSVHPNPIWTGYVKLRGGLVLLFIVLAFNTASFHCSVSLGKRSFTIALGSFALQSHCVWGLMRLSVPPYCRSLAGKTSLMWCQEPAQVQSPWCRLSECSPASYHTGFSKQCPPADIIPHKVAQAILRQLICH